MSAQEAQLHDAIDEGVAGWRQARGVLRQLMTGTDTHEDNQAELETLMKQADKILEYLKQQQELLIQQFLETQAQDSYEHQGA